MSRSYPDRPVVGVGAVILKDEAVLLVQRGKPPREGQWSLPGGAQKLGETVYEAAEREVREETGIEIGDLDLLDVVDFVDRDADGRVRHHYTLVDVTAQWRRGQPVPGDDAAAAAWVPLEALDHYGLWSETVRVIRAASARCALNTGS